MSKWPVLADVGRLVVAYSEAIDLHRSGPESWRAKLRYWSRTAQTRPVPRAMAAQGRAALPPFGVS